MSRRPTEGYEKDLLRVLYMQKISRRSISRRPSVGLPGYLIFKLTSDGFLFLEDLLRVLYT